ncbi:unnamed protein product, partial [Anisakis simplex]|uniref:COP9 signalosome complex subunit 2 n=1 Tax=Anisakis simplex TaxID=6269 RepID=A0A0M3JDN9_ANISI
MLTKSDINPFDSQEAKPFRHDTEIMAMNRLVGAYQNNDIREFENILKQNRETIMADPFIREHIEELLNNIRSQVLLQLSQPYSRIQLSYLADELHISVKEVVVLLVELILDGSLSATIDEIHSTLIANPPAPSA